MKKEDTILDKILEDCSENVKEGVKSFISQKFQEHAQQERERIIEIVSGMEDPYEHGACEGRGYDQALQDIINTLNQ